MLEKALESPLDYKQIKLVDPKGNQSWIFVLRIDAKEDTPTLRPPDAKNWLIWKDPDAGKDWRQEEKGRTEDEMVWGYHQLGEHEFEQALGAGDGQGSLAYCSLWGHRIRQDWATELNWNEWEKSNLKQLILIFIANSKANIAYNSLCHSTFKEYSMSNILE